MTRYLLIESRDPFDTNLVEDFTDLAKDLRSQGHEVTVFLVQNGVLPARKGSRSQPLADLVKAGVKVLADDFSLAERGIEQQRLLDGVKSGNVALIVDEMAAGTKTIWH
jgi:predicted peroxiredoxin